MSRNFDHFLTPHDLTVITKVMLRASHQEKDWTRRRELIGIVTKLQRSKVRRRSVRETADRPAPRSTDHPLVTQGVGLSAEQDGGR